jgi:hypothetical protein
MAREEEDREDLLREATALVERIELRLPDEPETVVVGFRRNGSMSVFFGADPVFQFNTIGELRRAYVGGKLYKAESGVLVELTRIRAEHEVRLQRCDLPCEASRAFLLMMAAKLLELRVAIAAEVVDVVGRVPTDVDVMPRVQSELQRVGKMSRLADSPRVG